MASRFNRVFVQGLFLLAGLMLNTPNSFANELPATRGHLIIVGGGLRLDNRPVFETLIKLSGGVEQANIVILPTASYSTADSHLFAKELATFNIPAQRAQVLDVTEHNAPASTSDAAILAQVRQASCLFISGGDQRRLVRVLTNPDGSDTPLLAECRALLARGGVIAGTSAGASAQSATMLAVSGLPDMLIDEGFDTLDFGIRHDQRQRGLLITRGFGFFDAGIIDQHFYHFRGRLSRLIRAVDHCQVPYGFGIEENTALIVEPTGRCRVLGAGLVTIIKTPKHGVDGPYGYRIDDVQLTALSDGDSFDPKTGTIDIDPAKPQHTTEKAEYNGNFLISDIAAGRSAQFALITGLAENQKPFQDSVMLKHHHDWSHGYRIGMRKTDATKAYAGIMNGEWTYSLLNIRVNIAPIANGIRAAESQRPADVAADHPSAAAMEALAFRGIMPLDNGLNFRGQQKMTRGELAAAMARSAHLHATTPETTVIHDVDWYTLDGEEIYRAVAAGFIGVDDAKNFRPQEQVTCDQAVHALRKLGLRDRDAIAPELLTRLEAIEQRAAQPILRDEVAAVLFDILNFGF